MPRLIYETYQCAAMTHVEYGFAFKREGSEDTEFDLVIGHIDSGVKAAEALGVVSRRIKRFEWAAQAIVNAQPQE